jgi:hypothetical protein
MDPAVVVVRTEFLKVPPYLHGITSCAAGAPQPAVEVVTLPYSADAELALVTHAIQVAEAALPPDSDAMVHVYIPSTLGANVVRAGPGARFVDSPPAQALVEAYHRRGAAREASALACAASRPDACRGLVRVVWAEDGALRAELVRRLRVSGVSLLLTSWTPGG